MKLFITSNSSVLTRQDAKLMEIHKNPVCIVFLVIIRKTQITSLGELQIALGSLFFLYLLC